MLQWLIPVCVFFPLVAIYLGALRVEPAGGRSFQQILGLLLTFAAYLGLWRLLHGVLGGWHPVLGGEILATVLSVLLLPLEARLGFLVAGVKLRRIAAGH